VLQRSRAFGRTRGTAQAAAPKRGGKTELCASRRATRRRWEAAIEEVWAARGPQIIGMVGGAGLTYLDVVECGDGRVIRSGFDDARKAFGADVAQSHVNLAGADDPDAHDGGCVRRALSLQLSRDRPGSAGES
jgi:hypothetical protein